MNLMIDLVLIWSLITAFVIFLLIIHNKNKKEDIEFNKTMRKIVRKSGEVEK